MNNDYIEIDPSPLATQALQLVAELEAAESPTVKFAKFCEETPWAPECKVYEV